MGCISSSNINNEISQSKKLNYQELLNAIETTKVLDDTDVLIYIDCSKSNLYVDGTSEHDNLIHSKNQNIIYNKYLFNLKILSKYISKSKLYFYGTEVADKNDDKIQEVLFTYNSNTSKVIKKSSEVCETSEDLLNSYIGGILSIKDKSYHLQYTKNSFFQDDFSLINCINNSISHTLKTKSEKFTIAVIITNTHSKKESNYYDDVINSIFKASQHPISIFYVCIGDNSQEYDILKSIDKLNYDDFYQKYLLQQNKNILNTQIVADFKDTNKSNIKKVKKYINSNQKFDNFTIILMDNIIHRPLISKAIENEYFKELFNDLPKQYIYIQQPDILNYVPKNK